MLSSTQRLDLRNTAILVIDDNERSLELMVQMLIGFRARPGTCRSAEEARAAVRDHRYDLLIVDGEMPREDGLEFVKSLRADRNNPNFAVPVLLVATHTPQTKILKARDTGANLVLRKPVSPAILLSRIEWLARSARQFVDASDYCGPDRRVRAGSPPAGAPERRSDLIALNPNSEKSPSLAEADCLLE